MLPKILQQVRDHIAAFVAHGATSSATAGRIVLRDVAGRFKASAPNEPDDVALLRTVTDGDTAIRTEMSAATASLQQSIQQSAASAAKALLAAPKKHTNQTLSSTLNTPNYLGENVLCVQLLLAGAGSWGSALDINGFLANSSNALFSESEERFYWGFTTTKWDAVTSLMLPVFGYKYMSIGNMSIAFTDISIRKMVAVL
jgi:hypothetical protein